MFQRGIAIAPLIQCYTFKGDNNVRRIKEKCLRKTRRSVGELVSNKLGIFRIHCHVFWLGLRWLDKYS